METAWNPELYQSGYAFVWEKAAELVHLLRPGQGEHILDLGCGTGQLAARIAESGAFVVGVDRSAAMIGEARRSHPAIRFGVAEATALPFTSEFDAVFSNAVLHWVKETDRAAASIAHALKPGGRFVAEFGGRGNVREIMAAIMAAIYDTLRDLGRRPEDLDPWYYPSIGEYAAVLERNGLETTFATLFDRPTPLVNGLAGWIDMFGGAFVAGMTGEERTRFVWEVERRAAPALCRDGNWTADYRRLRIAARRVR